MGMHTKRQTNVSTILHVKGRSLLTMIGSLGGFDHDPVNPP
jgi:hypothetical protein